MFSSASLHPKESVIRMIRRRLIAFVFVTGALAVFQLGCQSSSAVPAVKPPPGQAGKLAHAHPVHFDRLHIHVVNGYGEFRGEGTTFVPRGNNYVRLARVDGFYGSSFVAHTTFHVGLYDSTRAEDALSQMEALGYNLVRVFVNGDTFGSMYRSANGPLNNAYLANIADFLRRAKSHGIRTVLTTGFAFGRDASFAPCSANFGGENLRVLTSCGVAADKGFFTDLINGLDAAGAPMDAIFSYELRTEQIFNGNQLPLSLNAGMVTTANGQTYDMSNAMSRQQMMDDGLVFWANEVTAQIKALAPQTFVDIGFFAPNAPTVWRDNGDNTRIVKPYPAIASSNVDYVKFSLYPDQGLTLAEAAVNFGFAGFQQKPIVMGEFGELVNGFTIPQAASRLLNWQLDSCTTYHFKGWQLWTWDTEPAEQVDGPFWTAVDSNGVTTINDALAPANRPDPCAP